MDNYGLYFRNENHQSCNLDTFEESALWCLCDENLTLVEQQGAISN